jgi:hypothetical protein
MTKQVPPENELTVIPRGRPMPATSLDVTTRSLTEIRFAIASSAKDASANGKRTWRQRRGGELRPLDHRRRIAFAGCAESLLEDADPYLLTEGSEVRNLSRKTLAALGGRAVSST